MTYTVIVEGDNGAVIHEDHNLSERAATRLARQQAIEHRHDQVYITWSRESDGQRGYLNRSGHHEITGTAW